MTVGTSSAGGLTAAFTFSPSGPTAGSSVNFNASTSTSADPIASYKWDFGDGTIITTSSPNIAHTYGTAGAYTVTLIVTDSKSRKASTSNTVTVS